MGRGSDDDVAAFFSVNGAHFDGAFARFVQLNDIGFWRDDFGFSREIWTLYKLQ